MRTITPEIDELVRVAILMAQELQEFVDDAIDASDNPGALPSTQALLEDWERAFAAAGIQPRWQDVLVEQCGEGEELDI